MSTTNGNAPPGFHRLCQDMLPGLQTQEPSAHAAGKHSGTGRGFTLVGRQTNTEALPGNSDGRNRSCGGSPGPSPASPDTSCSLGESSPERPLPAQTRRHKAERPQSPGIAAAGQARPRRNSCAFPRPPQQPLRRAPRLPGSPPAEGRARDRRGPALQASRQSPRSPPGACPLRPARPLPEPSPGPAPPTAHGPAAPAPPRPVTCPAPAPSPPRSNRPRPPARDHVTRTLRADVTHTSRRL